MPTLNPRGEVADFLDTSQFAPGKSAFECVSYASCLIWGAGQPGHGATKTVLQISNTAQYWYGREEGSTDAANKNGMSLSAEYAMLTGLGLHFWGVSPSVDAIKAALAQGVPVLLCGAETGMFDMELGDRVPYNWTPTGNHCIVVSGVAHDGNLLVHDTANVDAQGKVRPGPRIYDHSKLQIVSATAVMVPGSAIQPAPKPEPVPAGWHFDEAQHILTAPNNVQVKYKPFVDEVLKGGWNKDNWAVTAGEYLDPLEYSNVPLGAGWQQRFRWTVLEEPVTRGTVIEGWTGPELAYLRGKAEELYKAYKTFMEAYQVGQAQPGTIADAQAKQ